MLDALPGWVVDNASSVAREAAPYVGLTPDERAQFLVQLCRTALSITLARPDAARVFAFRDKLPASSEAALARLRKLDATRERTHDDARSEASLV